MEAAFSAQRSAGSEKQHQSQKQNQTFETRRNGGSGGGEGLPPIHGKPGQVKAEDQDHVQLRAEALLRRIGEAYDELDRLAEDNPDLIGCATRDAEEYKEAYLRLKARLQLADAAPRCRWVRQDGTTCGSPQMKKHIYCFAHKQMMEAQALALRLPALEDANAIQIGIMRIQKALIDGTVSTKMAGLLLYSMQLALQNVEKVTFGQVKAEDLVRETVSEEEAFSDQRSAGSEEQDQNLETRRNGGSGGGEGLPLIHGEPGQVNADDFDSGKVDEQFVPMPGGYGYTRVRLRIEPESRPQQAAIGPERAAQPGGASTLASQTRACQGTRAVAHEHGEPLPKGPQFASELLEASTQGSALQAEPSANLG